MLDVGLHGPATIEQPSPAGRGIDVPSLVIYDLIRLDQNRLFAPVQTDEAETAYRYLIRLAAMIRLKIDPLVRGDEAYVLASDVEDRSIVVEKKSGQRLHVDDGRNALVDLFQELIDAILYMRKARTEGSL